MSQVRRGDKVRIHYTGKLKDGTVFETSIGGDPLAFTVGKGKLIAGLEQAVVGMVVGQVKTATVGPAQGYGPRRPELVATVAMQELPAGVEVRAGAEVEVRRADGSTVAGRVTAVEGDRVTVDGNHPLAGRNLTFEIRVVAVGG